MQSTHVGEGEAGMGAWFCFLWFGVCIMFTGVVDIGRRRLGVYVHHVRRLSRANAHLIAGFKLRHTNLGRF